MWRIFMQTVVFTLLTCICETYRLGYGNTEIVFAKNTLFVVATYMVVRLVFVFGFT